MSLQSFYNDVCSSLRTYGNQYGGSHTRGWAWVNPRNQNERCAIARFVKGNSDIEVSENLRKLLGLKDNQDLFSIDLVGKVTHLFDYYPCEINDKERLEYHLKQFADQNDLSYKCVDNKEEKNIQLSIYTEVECQ